MIKTLEEKGYAYSTEYGDVYFRTNKFVEYGTLSHQPLDALEAGLKARERELAAKESKRKQIVLRLPESLWNDIAKWAEDDFRSINAQIEYLLTKSVRERK